MRPIVWIIIVLWPIVAIVLYPFSIVWNVFFEIVSTISKRLTPRWIARRFSVMEHACINGIMWIALVIYLIPSALLALAAVVGYLGLKGIVNICLSWTGWRYTSRMRRTLRRRLHLHGQQRPSPLKQ